MSQLGYEVEFDNTINCLAHISNNKINFDIYINVESDQIENLAEKLKFSYENFDPNNMNKELHYIVVSQKLLSQLNFNDINEFVNSKIWSQASCISKNAFSGKQLTGTLKVPESVRYVYSNIIKNCMYLDYLEIPNSPKLSLLPNVLQDSFLKEIYIPEKINLLLDELNINQCSRVEKITIDLNNAKTISICGCNKLKKVIVNGNIHELIINVCPEFEEVIVNGYVYSIKMSGVNTDHITIPKNVKCLIDITCCPNLIELDIRDIEISSSIRPFIGCPNIKRILLKKGVVYEYLKEVYDEPKYLILKD